MAELPQSSGSCGVCRPANSGARRSGLCTCPSKLDTECPRPVGFARQSCIDAGLCNAFGQQTGIIRWRLDNDSTIREGFYETDSDRTNRFFAQGDGTRMDPQAKTLGEYLRAKVVEIPLSIPRVC